MWLTSQFMKLSGKDQQAVTANVTQSAGAKINAQGAVEHRDMPIVAPFGIAYSPIMEESAAIATVDDENYCIGVKMPDKSLSPGDLLLYSGDTASILIRADGTIAINGSVEINGVSV